MIVRIVTQDDPEQAQRAVALFEREGLFIAKTVLLEVEWVLRFSYQLPREVIAPTLRKVIGLPNVEVENPDEVFIALDAVSYTHLDVYKRQVVSLVAFHLVSIVQSILRRAQPAWYLSLIHIYQDWIQFF